LKRDQRGAGVGRGTDALRRRIEEMRSLTGHALRCTGCHRLSSGLATGWKLRRGDDGQLFALCPECGELELG
jgi:hypothetical protein